MENTQQLKKNWRNPPNKLSTHTVHFIIIPIKLLPSLHVYTHEDGPESLGNQKEYGLQRNNGLVIVHKKLISSSPTEHFLDYGW